jgi:nucleotide-binding universal stress UspA family protein
MNKSPGRIVVGVDGSEAGRSALTVAFSEACRRHCAVDVVTTCEAPPPYGLYNMMPPIATWEEDAQTIQDEQIQAVAATCADVPAYTCKVIYGHAGHSLVAESDGAELLVVGTHHKNALERVILGSTSQYCVRHALCPVLVVPPTPAYISSPAPAAQSA